MTSATATLSCSELAEAPAGDRILEEVERAVVGKRAALELVLLGLLADGHVLIEDYPGLAKTLIARSFAAATGLRFTRVQFTPDLMPADVTGASIFNQRTARFEFRPGPMFTNVLLGRRDQPRPAEDPGGAAGGDAGAPGHDRGPHRAGSSGRFWCSPRRTRSSTRAPIRCPRRSSTVSCCGCGRLSLGRGRMADPRSAASRATTTRSSFRRSSTARS